MEILFIGVMLIGLYFMLGSNDAYVRFGVSFKHQTIYLICMFGLAGIIFKDQIGGNVDTIHNVRNTDKRYFIVWKISGEYFYWEINHDKKEYYIEDQFRDRGKGYRQETAVVNVKEYALKRF